jgi:hypothetical protein
MAIGSIVLVFSSKGLALRVFLHPPEAEAEDTNCPCHIHIKSSSFNGDPFQAFRNWLSTNPASYVRP